MRRRATAAQVLRAATKRPKQSRLPDLRNLLHWKPEIMTSGSGPQNLPFYTGDQSSRYLVVLQGIATDGLAGSTNFVLDVKPAL